MKNWKKYTFFLLIVAIIAALILYGHYKNKPAPAVAFVPPPAAVRFATATMQHWPDIVFATGTVSSVRGVTIRAQVAGQVLRKLVDSGHLVKQGEAIYQIDPQGLAQLIKQNKAQLILTREQLSEQQKLFKKGYVAKNSFDKAKEAYDVAFNTLQQNQQKLALTEVRAPFSGRLGVTLVHIGDYVSVNDKLVSLQDPNHLRVDFTVSGGDAGRVQVGQLVTFTVAQYPGKQFKAKVTAVNTNVNQTNQSILVRANLDKADVPIVPGAFSDVQLYTHASTPVLTVPQTALVYSDAGVAVYHVINGVAHLIPVTTGQRLKLGIAISSGLNVGDVVVSEGKIKLMDGARVKESNGEK